MTQIAPHDSNDDSLIDSIAHCLELDIGFDQYGVLRAYKTDSWNFFKDGKYVGGRKFDAPTGAEHHGFIVNWGDPKATQEKAFVTAREAAEFFLKKKAELQI